MTRKDNPFRILRVGDGWLAVEKSAGISVHNDPGADLLSLIEAYVLQQEDLRKEIGLEDDLSLHPVHRLDKETSGVMILAGNAETFRFLSRQFQDRTVEKRYAAVLWGNLRIKGDSDRIRWEWTRPLSKSAGGGANPAGSGRKVPCRTRYRILRRTRHFTLLECELLTGRKHQIRRHARLAGHPVAGDTRYAPKRQVSELADRYQFRRLALHSLSLTFRPPENDVPLTLQTPIPPAMKALLA